MAQEITTYDEVSTIDKDTKLLLTKDGGLGQKSIEEVGNVINGTEDISKIGDGTVKGAIRGLNDEMAKGIQSEIAAGKNLFNLKNIEKGYVIDFNTGRTLQNASYFISDYIKVTPGDQYTKQGFTSSGEHWFYDKDKNPVSNLGINSFTVPHNAQYVRLSGTVGNESKCMLEKGSTPTSYEPFIPSNLMLNNMLSNMEESVLYIGSNDDLDDCKDIYKKYQWNTNQQPKNAPFTEGGVVYIKYGFGAGGIIQFACKYNTPDIYIRVKYTTWSSWKKIACS